MYSLENEIVSLSEFPPPDFIKIDVQGAELDILQGMTNTLKTVKRPHLGG